MAIKGSTLDEHQEKIAVKARGRLTLHLCLPSPIICKLANINEKCHLASDSAPPPYHIICHGCLKTPIDTQNRKGSYWSGREQCTMGLPIEIGERNIFESKWLDFSHFSTKDGYFDLYWCKTANILPEK